MFDCDCLLITLRDNLLLTHQLLKEIGVQTPCTEKPNNVSQDCFNWHATNKYFTKDIRICCSTIENIENSTATCSIEMIVFVLDKIEAYVELKKSYPLLKMLFDECLVFCYNDSFLVHEIDDVEDWCIKHNAELLLSRNDEEKDEEWHEKVGNDRLIEVLNCHVWKDHALKESSSSDNLMSTCDYENFFAEFKHMKERADSLAGDERKMYAEKVALKFAELLELSDSE